MPIAVQEIGIDIPFGSSLSGALHSHITHSLYVTGESSVLVGDIDVVVYIDHTWIGDVTLELEHDGLRRTLVTQPGGALCSQDDLFHVVFDEQAEGTLGKTRYSPGVCTFRSQGVYQPEESLTAFSGSSASGQWTLHVIDNVPGSENGKLIGWGVVIQPDEDVFVSTSHSAIPPLLLTSILSPYQTVSLNINSPGRITNLVPRIHISQPYEGGLLYLPQLVLTHPDGTQVQLSYETYLPCINGNYTYLIFSDTATYTPYSQCISNSSTNTSSLSNSKDSLIDILPPVSSLSTLVGRRSGGEWLLTAWVSRASSMQLLGWNMYMSTEPNIDADYNVATGVLTLTGFDSANSYLDIIRSVQYNTTSPSPTFWIRRTVETLLFDGQANSQPIQSSQTDIILHHIEIDLDPLDVTSAPHPGYNTTFTEHSFSTQIVHPAVILRDEYLSEGSYRLQLVLQGVQNGVSEFVSVVISNNSTILTESFHNSIRSEYTLIVYNRGLLLPISEFQNILKSATYSNSADEMTGTNRTVSISISENSTGIAYPSLEATVFIELFHTNDAPVLILNTFFQNIGDISNFLEYTEGQGTLQLAAAGTISLYDRDHDYLQRVTVVITNPKEPMDEILLINGTLPRGVNYTYNADTLTLTLYGNASIDSYIQAISRVNYQHLLHPGMPDTTPRLVSFTAFDGIRYGVTTHAYVSFSSVNDAPIITSETDTGVFFSTSFREEMGPIPIVFDDTKLFDIDNSTLQYIEISIFNPLDGDDEYIYVNPATTVETISNNQIQHSTFTPVLTYPYGDNSTVIISGLNSVVEYELVLHEARYDNLADEPSIDTREISIVISDGLETATAQTRVMIVLVNDSPRIVQGVNAYSTYINEDQLDDGISVFDTSYLFEDDDSGDGQGIGIVGADCDSGTWQLIGSLLDCENPISTNNSRNATLRCALDWLTIPCDVSIDNSFLVRYKAGTRLRFVPDLNFYGNTSLTVVAWDGTDEQVDVLKKSAVSTSEIDAFSSEQTVLTFIVQPVNDAPVLQSIPLTMPTILEDDFNSVGVLVSTLTIYTYDVDRDHLPIGVAVTSVDNSNGVWQYQLSTATGWYNISLADVSQAVLLDPNSRVRFTPNLNFHGTTSFSFKAWDQSNNSIPGSIESTITPNPHLAQFSLQNTTVSLTVDPVNDSPVIQSADFSIDPLYEDIPGSLNHGLTVNDVINGYYSDIDSVLDANHTETGLAVIWVDNTFGSWQYSCNTSGVSWRNFIGDIQYGHTFPELPLPDKATLLLAHCRIRFVPELYFNTELDLQNQPRPLSNRPSILVRGWDNTGLTQGRSGTYGNDASYAALSHTNEYTVTSHYISVNISSINNIPILHLTNATVQTFFTTFIEDLSGVRLVSNDVYLVDYDHDMLDSLTVSIKTGSSNDFLSNSSYCQWGDLRIESILFDLTDTDLQAMISLCPYSIVFTPKSGHVYPSVHISQYYRVLRTLIFSNEIEEPSPGDRVVEFFVTDEVNRSISSYTFVSVQLVNDAPILDLNTQLPDLHNRVSFVEGEGPLVLANISLIQLIDYDNLNLSLAIISLSPSPDMLHEVLHASTAGTNVVSYYNYTTATLTLNGTDSIRNYLHVIASVTYNNTNTDAPDETEREVRFTVSDGDKYSSIAISYVSFQGVNNHPSLDVNGDGIGIDYTTEFKEEQGPVSIVDPGLSLIDVDDDTLAFVSVRITNPLDGDSEFLTVDNVTMEKTVISNQLGIPKIIETTLLVANATFNSINHELLISGLDSVEEYELVLTTIRYNNVKNEINTELRIIHFYASDGLLLSPLAQTNITLEHVNDSPYFISPAVLIFPQINEDEIDSSGFSIMQLAAGLINDSDVTDPRGIAVISADSENGTWQYRLDVSSNWININSVISLYDALLLTADVDNYIRFMPRSDFNGNVTISFLAWDSSDGYVDGNRRSADPLLRTNLDAFSDEARTLTLEVIPINDSPVVLPLAAIQMPSILEDDYDSYGVSILFLATLLEVDVDSYEFGIAIVDTDSLSGEWEYTLDNGTSWLEVTGVTESGALVFRGNSVYERIRFVPDLNFNEQSNLRYKLWDLTTPELSGTSGISTLTDPEVGPYSIESADAVITIEPVNDSPLLASGLVLAPIDENVNPSNNMGNLVRTIINMGFSDVDSNFQSGIAVVGVDHRNGEFEYSCDGGGTAWRPFVGDMAYGQIAPRLPFPSKATLLSEHCKIRFKPNTDFNTVYDLTGASWTEDIVPYLSVRGWDRTSGGVGEYGVNTESDPDDITNSFSAETVNITIVVRSVNRPPVIHLQTDDNSFQTTFYEPTPPLRVVNPVPLVDVDSVSITDSDHIHLLALRVSLARLDGLAEIILYDLSMTNLNATVLTDDNDNLLLQFSSSDAQTPALLAYYVMLLKSLRYQNTIEEPNPANRLISFLLVDPHSSATSVLTTVFIQLVNDPPELDLDNTTTNLNTFVSYREGQGELFFLKSTKLSLLDYDSPSLQNATITLTNPIDGVYEVLRATSTPSINVTYSNHRLVLTGPAPVSEFSRVLLSISYEHTNSSPGNPDTTTRLVEFSISDYTGTSILAVTYILFSSVNNAPILDLNGNQAGEDYSTSFFEEQGPIRVLSADKLLLVDVDNKTLDRITVKLFNPSLDDFLYVDNVTLYSDNPEIAKIVILTNLRSKQQFNVSSGELVISGLDYVREYETVLKTLRYDNSADETGNFIKILSVIASDGILNSNETFIYINVSEVNDAPSINLSIPIIRSEIQEDVRDSDNMGVSVSSMILPIFNDVDSITQPGIAVIGADSSTGLWEYIVIQNINSSNSSQFSISPNATWTPFPSVVATEYALLLRAAGEFVRIRFIPAQDFNGETSISFVAWDGSDLYPSGQILSLSNSDPITGAYSGMYAEFFIDVAPVNDAPILQTIPPSTLTIQEDEVTSFGISVVQLVSRVTDVDNENGFGLVVVMNDNSNGTWEYTTTGGLTWYQIDSTTPSNALLISSSTHEGYRIRFVPDLNFNGERELSYLAWDQTSGGVPDTYTDTLTADPVTSPFSSEIATLILTVESVNDSPYFDGENSLNLIIEDMINFGTAVSDIVADSFRDIDYGYQVGIAVTGVDSRYGKWEWRCEESQNWQEFIGDIVFGIRTPFYPIPLRATLLSADCTIRFIPDSNFNTEKHYYTGLPRPPSDVPYITILAWDVTVGLSGTYGVDTTYHNSSNTNEFSFFASTATVDVMSVNDPPLVQISQQGIAYSTVFREDGGAVPIVEPPQMFITDIDQDRLESVEVVLERVYDSGYENISLSLNAGVVVSGNYVYVNTSVNETERLVFSVGESNGVFKFVLSNPSPQERGSVAAYQTVIRTLVYTNYNPEPTNSTRYIRFYVNDGEEVNNYAVTTVYIELIVENIPVLNLGISQITFGEDFIESLSIVSQDLTLTDIDHNEYFYIIAANIFFDQPPESHLEYISITTPSAACNNNTVLSPNTSRSITCNTSLLTATYDLTQGRITVSGAASLDVYRDTLRTVVYTNRIREPTDIERFITFEVFDTNNLKSNPVSVKITIELRNDQPPVFTAGGVYRYIEQQPTNAYPLVIGDNVTYTDADSGEDLQYSVTVSIANPIDVPYELLSANPPSAGISVVYHTVDVVYSTIETIEVCVNVTDNSTTSLPSGNATVTSPNMNNSNATSTPVPVTVLQCTNVTDAVNKTNQTTIYTALTLVGPASISDFLEALTTVTYSNGAEEPTTIPRRVTFLANDYNLTSDLPEITINIFRTNDLPIVDLNGFMIGTRFMIAFEEGSEPVPIVDSLYMNISDNDHTHLVGATVVLSTVYDKQKEILGVTTAGASLTVNYNTSTGVLSVTGNASIEVYQSVLRTLTYVNLEAGPGAPNPSMREISVIVSDPLENSVPAYSIVTFLTVNDPPFLDLNGNLIGENSTALFIEEGQKVRVFSPDAIIMDIDNGTLASLAISLTNPVDGEKERIFIDPDVFSLLNPMGSIQTTNHSILLTNFLSTNKYVMALQSIYYINTMDEPSYDARYVSVVAFDGLLTNVLSYVGTITIQPVNDLPQFSFNADPNSNATFEVEYRENSDSIPVVKVVSSDFTLTDDDDPILTRIIIERSPVPAPDGDYEKLFFQLSTPIPGLGHTFVGCPLQSISNPLTLDLQVSLTLEQWRTALSSLSYCNMDPNSFGGVRQISIVLVDGKGGRSAVRTSNVNVIPINDPPIFKAPPPFITTNEDNSVQIRVLSNFTDYEETLTGSAIRIESPPPRGVASVMESTGVILFQPTLNDNGIVTLQFIACDSQDNCSLPITATIMIIPVNDRPTPVGSNVISVEEDGTVRVNLLEYFTDVEDTPSTNNTRVIQTPRGGSWEYNMDQEVFTYSPTLNRVVDDSLEFEACDNGGLCINITLTFMIIPVNDLPIITVNYVNDISPLMIIEDTAVNVSVFIQDVEDGDELEINILSVDNGVVRVFTISTELLPTNEFIQRVYIEYTPSANFYGDETIEFSATDNDDGTSIATIEIMVEYHNDAPTIEITSISLNEDGLLELTLPQGLGISDNEYTIKSQDIELLTDTSTVPGDLSYNSNTGVLRYTPVPNSHEDVTFTLRVCDQDTVGEMECTELAISIIVTAVNDAPIFTPFIFYMQEDSSNTTNILPYFDDVEDHIVLPGRISLTTPLSSYGTATYSANSGDLTYTPQNDFFGADTITLSVCDRSNLCTIATVQVYVTGVNDPPMAEGLTHTSPEDEIDLINIGTIVRDVDTLPGSQVIQLRISIVEIVEGTTSLIDSGTTKESGDIRVFQDEGIISYEPPPNFIGYDEFTFAVCDYCDVSRNAELGRTTLDEVECLNQIEENDGETINPVTGMSIACSIGTIVIVVVNRNDVPVLRDISVTTTMNAAVTIDPFGTQQLFADPTSFVYDEDDKQAAFAISQGFNLAELHLSSTSNVNMELITIKSQAVGGTTEIVGTDRVYVIYTPESNYVGYDEFQYEVCDLSLITTCGNAIARVFVASPGPRIVSLVVTGSENLLDSKVSRGDTVQISFSEPTNQPPQLGKDFTGIFCGSAVDQVITFDFPFINSTLFPNAYCAKWDTPSLLTVTILERGYPEPSPRIDEWRVSVTQDTSRVCTGFGPNHQRYDDSSIDTNCLFNVALTSSHSDSISPVATGDWGVELPSVSTAIIQNLNIRGGTEGISSSTQPISVGSLIKVQLREPFSSKQLELYCQININEILNIQRIYAGTRMELISCSNLLNDGTNADQLYSEKPESSISSLGYPMVSELVFEMISLDPRFVEETNGNSNLMLSSILLAIRQAPFASVVEATLNVVIFVAPDAEVGQIGTINPIMEHLDVDTPVVVNAIAQDPDNFDDVYSNFDVLRITFSVETNQPAVGSKEELDKIFVFTPSLGVKYLGTWETSRVLLVIILDSSRPEVNGTVPTVDNLKLEFLPNYLNNETLVNSSSITSERLHCIGDNVCSTSATAITLGVCDSTETSCRAKTPFTSFTGNFGTAEGVIETPVGVIAGVTVGIVVVIIILAIIIIILLLYYCYKRVQEKRDRDKALALVRSWKQKQKALSEQQKKPSMMGIDESWKSPPTMPLMRGNIDPFSPTVPKLSMESGAFISPTPYEPFQPRAYPSILDSSLGYPTTGSALPPIALRTVSHICTVYTC